VLHATRDQLPVVLPKLQLLNAGGAGVFVTVNETNGRGRKGSDIVCVRALYVDLDGAPLEPVLTSERPPHIVNATSPGKFHCYWLVEDMPLEDFRGAQEALLEKFGGDRNVKSVEHVMRVPGFFHRKGAPFLCRIHTVNQRPPYRADEFEKKPQPVYVPRTDNDDEVNLKAVREAVIFIANPNLPWAEWNRIGMAIFRATGGCEDGFEIFDRLSQRSAKYNARTTRARWQHYFHSPPERVGIATLIHLATKAVPDWRDRLDYALWERVARQNYGVSFYELCGIATPEEQAAGAPLIKKRAPGLRESEAQDRAAFSDVKDKPTAELPPPQPEPPPSPQPKPMPQHIKVLASAKAYAIPAETTLPMWDFLCGKHLLRQTVSGTAAFGGTGKSSLAITEGLAMTAHRPLLGVLSPRPLRVALINFEDTRNTMDKRIVAAMKHYQLKPEDIGGRLFVIAKGELSIQIATQGRFEVIRDEQMINELIAFVHNNKIDVLSIDPFVATHGVNENDNQKIWAVIACYDTVAERGNCAISLWHHTRKSGGGEVTVESARGAGAFIDANRAVRILETMTKEEAAKLNIEHPGYYFRSFSGKRNFAPPTHKSTWFRFQNVELNNNGPLFGDEVGVVTSWEHPGAQALDLTLDKIIAIQQRVANGQWREDARAAMWAGKAVALALGLEAADGRIKDVLKRLLQDGFLQVQPGVDEHRHTKLFVVVGPGPAGAPAPAAVS
jgi:hypothetical protein